MEVIDPPSLKQLGDRVTREQLLAYARLALDAARVDVPHDPAVEDGDEHAADRGFVFDLARCCLCNDYP